MAGGIEATDDPGAALLSVTSSSGSQQGSQQEGSDGQLTSESGGSIQRDEKGYSKVDKAKKSKALAVEATGNSGREESEDRPPPLPERLYSVEGDVIDTITDV